MIVGNLRCMACGGAEIIAIAPGEEPERAGDEGTLFSAIVLAAGHPTKAWCIDCWDWNSKETLVSAYSELEL